MSSFGITIIVINFLEWSLIDQNRAVSTNLQLMAPDLFIFNLWILFNSYLHAETDPADLH